MEINRRETILAGLAYAVGGIVERFSVMLGSGKTAKAWWGQLPADWPCCDLCNMPAHTMSCDAICTGHGEESDCQEFKPGDVRRRCTLHGPTDSLTFYPESESPHGEGWYLYMDNKYKQRPCVKVNREEYLRSIGHA